MVINLCDVNKASVFIHALPPDVLLYHKISNKVSLFMVHHAQSVAEYNNNILGVYPGPKSKNYKKPHKYINTSIKL